jgi:hypothetical protein
VMTHPVPLPSWVRSGIMRLFIFAPTHLSPISERTA